MSTMRRDPVLTALVVLGILGLFIALRWRDQGFPIAAIDFRVLRGDALRLAGDYARERVPGFPLERQLSAVGFSVESQGQAYVERHAGLAALNRLGNTELAIWFWRARFFRPSQREEVSVSIHPSGRVIAFQHRIAEDQPGAALDEAAAREVAERFVAGELGRNLRWLRLVDSRRETRPSGRADHHFTWERTDFRLAEATARLRVTIQGDSIGGFQEYLHVPEAWMTALQREANRGRTLAGVSEIGYAALVLAALVVAFRRARSGDLRWRFAALWGAAAGVLVILATLNSLPLFLLSYPTAADLAAYLGQALMAGATGAVALALLILVLGASGLAVAREQRARPGLSTLISRAGLRSRALPRTIAAGYAIAGMWAGYVVTFYWAGVKLFGAWVPVEVPYDDIMSTVAPVIYPLTIGVYPAVDEEFTFRLFAVSLLALLLTRWLRWRRLAVGVAVIVPGAVWAALHSTYPQQPFYTRAVELTVVGAVNGLLFLRYGVLATMVSHYLYNAGVTGALFFLSGHPYLLVSGAVPLVLPALLLVPAAVHRLRGGVLLTDRELIDRARAAVIPPAPAESARVGEPAREEVHPLPSLGRRAAVLVGTLGLASLGLAAALPVPAPADALRLRLGPEQAAARARDVLRELGVLPAVSGEGWVVQAAVVGPPGAGAGGSPVPVAATYLRRQLGTAEANRVLEEALVPAGWRVRYFRPLQREELSVRIAPDGRLAAFQQVLEEEAAGARLSTEEARGLAERAWGPYELPFSRLRLIDAATEVRDARTDHRFVWEWPEALAGEARRRAAVEVQGERPGRLHRLVKVPETFERAMAGTQTHQVAARAALGLGAVALAIWLLVLLGQAVRRGEANGRLGAAAAGVVVAGAAVQWLDELPALLQGYVTTISVPNYVLLQVANALLMLGLAFVGTFVAVVLAEWLYRQTLPGRPPVSEQLLALVPRVSSHPWASLAAAAPAALGLLGLAAAVTLAHGWVGEIALRGGLTWDPNWQLGLLNAALPVVHAFSGAVTIGVAGTAAFGAVVLGLHRWLRRPLVVASALLLAGLVGSAADARNWQEFAVGATQWGLAVPAGFVAVRWLARERVTVYVLAAYAAAMGIAAHGLLGQETGWYEAHGWLVLVLGVGPLVGGFGRAVLMPAESGARARLVATRGPGR